MFFDRNEIHIQVGVLFNNEKISFPIPHLRKIILKIYTQKLDTQNNFQKMVGLPFENFEKTRKL